MKKSKKSLAIYFATSLDGLQIEESSTIYAFTDLDDSSESSDYRRTFGDAEYLWINTWLKSNQELARHEYAHVSRLVRTNNVQAMAAYHQHLTENDSPQPKLELLSPISPGGYQYQILVRFGDL